jgi:hypothetical protein
MSAEELKEAGAVAVLLGLLFGMMFVTSAIAERKGRFSPLWFFAGLLVPVVPLIAVLLVSDRSKTPVAVASAWLRSVLRGDLRGAWLKTDHGFRRAVARAWLTAARVDSIVSAHPVAEAAESLATVAFNHPLWVAFEEAQLRDFAAVIPPEFNSTEWGAPNGAQPIGSDRRLVVFVFEGGVEKILAKPSLADERIPVVVRYAGEQWAVAALGAAAGQESPRVRYILTPPARR